MTRIFDWLIENLDFVLTVFIALIVLVLVSLGYISTNQIDATILTVLIALTLFLAVKNYRLGTKVNAATQSLFNVEQKIEGMTSARILSGTEEFFAH